MTKQDIYKYFAEIGRRGGAAGKGDCKRRTHAQAVAAGKAGAIARWKGGKPGQ